VTPIPRSDFGMRLGNRISLAGFVLVLGLVGGPTFAGHFASVNVAAASGPIDPLNQPMPTMVAPGPGGKVCDVTDPKYVGGAIATIDPAPTKDSTAAFLAAIQDCTASANNVIEVPRGTGRPGHPAVYSVGAALPLETFHPATERTYAVTFAGQGRDYVTLRELNTNASLVGMRADHDIVRSITLDTVTANAKQSIGTSMDYTQALWLRVLHGNHTAGFSLYYAGNFNPNGHSTGNVVDQLELSDTMCDDGFVWAWQANGAISNLTYRGSRLAMYRDSHDTVTNFTYTPGPQTCIAKLNAFYVSAPSDHIAFINFTSSGQGGKTSSNSTAPNGISALTIEGYTLTGTGDELQIGNVADATISDYNSGGVDIPCNFGADRLRILPGIVGNGTTLLHNNVTLTNCTVGRVAFAQRSGIPVTLTMDNPTLLQNSQGTATFGSFFGLQGAVSAVKITGGTWGNSPYWLDKGSAGFTWQLSGLTPCPLTAPLHC
jgi:hypothetical protein